MGDVIRFPVKFPAGMVSPVVPPGHCALDPLLELMRRNRTPLTHENYIALVTDADTVEWTAEHDANLPEELRYDSR